MGRLRTWRRSTGAGLLPGYLLAVCTGAAVNMGTMVGADALVGVRSGAAFVTAAVAARLLANTWTFFAADRTVFRGLRRRSGRSTSQRFVRFHVVAVISFLAYLAISAASVWAGAHYLVATALGIGAGFVFSFGGVTQWVYADGAPPEGRSRPDGP